MRLEAPLALSAQLLVPFAVAAYLALERRPSRYAVHFTNVDVLATCMPHAPRWRSHVPAALMLLALACALGALARPQQHQVAARQQASVALVVDSSGSMAADDIEPSRMVAARAAVRTFLAGLPRSFRVGLVVFSSSAYVASPLTRDRGAVLRALDLESAPGKGTAIGDALARSVSLLEGRSVNDARQLASFEPDPATSPPAILLLSDGAQTRGRLAPLQGAARAAVRGIPVHTVALGTANGMISEGVISLPVPPDPVTLQRISILTGGRFSAAMDAASVNAVYARLAWQLGWESHWRELAPFLLALAAAFALAGCAASLVVHGRLP